MKAKDLERKFDRGEDIMEHLDLSHAQRLGLKLRPIEVAIPAWMVNAIDRTAGRYGVTREAVIKMWLAERLERKPIC